MKKIYFISILMLVTQISLFSQDSKDYQLGSKFTNVSHNVYGGFYDYSDSETFNISISVWGFVKYPGKYMVPDYTTVIDLLSYVGGPSDDSNLDDLRIYRIEGNTEQMISFNYNDLMWENELDAKYKKIPTLKPGDIFVVPGEPRMYFLDWLYLGFGVVSALSLLVTLYITLNK